MTFTFSEKVASCQAGICLYGIAPPKQATAPEQLAGIVEQQVARLQPLELDGLIVYDIQDEADRMSVPRPFPFLPTIDPETYAHEHLGRVAAPKIVYRCVARDSPASFIRWLVSANQPVTPRISVLVGASTSGARVSLTLADAYDLARQHAPGSLAWRHRDRRTGMRGASTNTSGFSPRRRRAADFL